MIVQDRDGSLVCGAASERRPLARHRVYAEIEAPVLQEQASLIERLIAFAFDTVGVRRVEVRVLDTGSTQE